VSAPARCEAAGTEHAALPRSRRRLRAAPVQPTSSTPSTQPHRQQPAEAAAAAATRSEQGLLQCMNEAADEYSELAKQIAFS